MIKKGSFAAIMLAVVLVTGAIFASAAFLEQGGESKEMEASDEPLCEEIGCKEECGNKCGIPSCGCGG